MGSIKKNYFVSKVLLFSMMILLSGCSHGVLSPHGDIVKQEYNLILISLIMMMLVVIPVIFMTFYFVWKYKDRVLNNTSVYLPNWNYSYKIEFLIWSIPCVIIFILAVLSWKSTHSLEPSKPIVSDYDPIKIEVVALDWKWLFIYPDYKIATINKIVIPINTPITFYVTSSSVMNSFFIPSLGSQIYAMNGMVSKLNLIANESGIYKGFSANYSGSGFSNMKFMVHVVPNNHMFYKWINNVKKSELFLNTLESFKKVTAIEEYSSVKYFSNILPNLFNQIVQQKIDYKNN